MATVNDWPDISALVATPSIGSISLNTEYVDPHENGLPYLKTIRFEYWASATDDVNAASKVAEGLAAAKWEDAALVGGVTRYLWVRPVRAGRTPAGLVYTYGPFHPADGGSEVVMSYDSAPWLDYTPVATAEAGSISGQSLTGIYKIIGTTCTFVAHGSVTGSGTGYISLTLPVPNASGVDMLGICIISAPVPSALTVGYCVVHEDNVIIWAFDSSNYDLSEMAFRVQATYEVA